MIIAFEPVWTAATHAPGNSATLQTMAQAFPRQQIAVLADPSHISVLRADPPLAALSNIAFREAAVCPHFQFKTHVVSARRFRYELAALRTALAQAPAEEPCLLMLLSATPTAIFAASLVACTARRRVMVQVCLHGNLNELTGWRSRNPLVRAFDLTAALAAQHHGKVRFLVLEEAIRRELARIAPRAALVTDVLPLPVNRAEIALCEYTPLDYPVRIGLVGQATEVKGITPFLALARYCQVQYPGLAEFDLVGRVIPGDDLARFAPLASAVKTSSMPRTEFQARLARLHYICLPVQPSYYSLSASGALIDAITWLKPVIATRLPIIADLAERFGDIGYLCQDEAEMRQTVDSILHCLDPDRYRQQGAALRRARAERIPERLAERYRSIIHREFGDLLGDGSMRPNETSNAS